MKSKIYIAVLFALAATSACTITPAKELLLPTDKQATEETVHLYNHLLKQQQQGMMFGHQDDLAYGKGWIDEPGRSDVKEVCGDYPAVYGWELGHLELGNAYSLDSVYFDRIRDWILEAYERGGVNTISWHLRNPLTGGTAWDVSTPGVVASVLPGGEKHELYTQYLDHLADFLLSLKTDNGTYVPILFRPFHEHTGSWFWWGKDLCTPEEYKALWRFTQTYLRDTKNIHHLLYSYSTDRFKSQEKYLERYPGDDVIDLLGFDMYDRSPGYRDLLDKCAATVSRLAKEKGKIAAMTEAGGPIETDTEWWTVTILKTLKPYGLSYVLVWRNPTNKIWEAFAPYPGHPSEADFIQFYNDPETIFQQEATAAKLYN
ncbi:glycoside hydrolase family 26 protein [Mangrovibacterium lignilyticum]|uniref:glycoside hydrolase family 26 protein n=1 Tax=Mangrovibacterium lignilyticum TaxID=2668052 RepID=UPI0013D17D6D|nr:glycosyl hydrolase [Mangrovibacterium lignilyticum]